MIRFMAILSLPALIGLMPDSLHAAVGPTQAEVDRAITRGVSYLKEAQGAAGRWSFSYNSNHDLGITALAGLALLENGVDPADPLIAKATESVRTLARRSDQTYDVSLAILFLARVQKGLPGANDPLIRKLSARLSNGSHSGIWDYTVPVQSESEEEAPRPTTRRGTSAPMPGRGDNSNTQFALLGVWAASRHGSDLNATLEAIDTHFRSTINRDGRWGYSPGEGSSPSMTCAGLMGLAIASARPALAERQTARARGASLASDPTFINALKGVSRDARSINEETDIYYIWSLERVCVALGLRDLDGFDWYAAGAKELLRRQREDGGWPEAHWGRLPNTCLALLFLRKANLAFELDRVLKLPGSGRPATTALADAVEVSPSAPVNTDEASVVITGANEAGFPEIAVDFEVKRPDGSYLLDATKDDFHVTENGVESPIVRLLAPATRDAKPITVVLVVDRSKSMEEEDRIGALKRAVTRFLDGLPKGSRVAVVAFGTDVQLIAPFTEKFAEVGRSVDRLRASGATRYYDAVAEALELIKGEPGRRAVLAMTDGEDTFSQSADLDSVIAAARRLGLPIHTLGLGTEDEIESDALKKLARETRGQYYSARQADQLRAIYEQLAERLRSSYTLVYRTDRRIPDGTLRPVRVSYRAGKQAGETAVFIPGMVVPAAGWSPLFLVMITALLSLAVLPGYLRRQGS